MKTRKKFMTPLAQVLATSVLTTGLICNYNIQNISAKEVIGNVNDSLISGNGQTIKPSIQNNLILASIENATTTGSDTIKNNSDSINKLIYGLSYDPYKILSNNGESISSFIPAEGNEISNKYIVVTREKKSISNSTADISILDSMNSRTYPGAIQFANQNLVDNRPDMLVCDRKPMTISVDLPGMTDDGKTVVNSPSYSSVNSAVNSLLNTWNSKYSSTYSIPTRMSYTSSMVYSQAQLSTMFGCNLSGQIDPTLSAALNIDFDSIEKGEKQAMVVAYKQIFYTVSVDAPNHPSDLFGDSVTSDELALKGVNNNNPPAYVSNVSYGRTIYVKLETTSKSADVKAAFKALIENQNISSNAEYQDILNQSSFTATVLGGGAQQHNQIITTDYNQILNVIKNNAVYSPQNPGYPISYSTTFLKDNSIACTNNMTDYIETTTNEYPDGKIILDQTGGYVGQFEVTWDEVSYDPQGNKVIVHKAWSGNDKDLTSPFNTEIYLPGNATNISVKAKECTGLAWEWWRTVIDEQNVPLVKERTFHIGGTTLNPTKSSVYNCLCKLQCGYNKKIYIPRRYTDFYVIKKRTFKRIY